MKLLMILFLLKLYARINIFRQWILYLRILRSENSKTTDPNRLLLNLSDKINLKRSDKYVAL